MSWLPERGPSCVTHHFRWFMLITHAAVRDYGPSGGGYICTFQYTARSAMLCRNNGLGADIKPLWMFVWCRDLHVAGSDWPILNPPCLAYWCLLSALVIVTCNIVQNQCAPVDSGNTSDNRFTTLDYSKEMVVTETVYSRHTYTILYHTYKLKSLAEYIIRYWTSLLLGNGETQVTFLQF